MVPKNRNIKRFKYDDVDIHVNYRKSRVLTESTSRRWLEPISQFASIDSTELVLDLGCGTGRFLSSLAEQFRARIIGIEPSAKMLSEAVTEDLSSNIKLIRGGAENIGVMENSVDLVFISMAIHHFSDRHRAYSEIMRTLKPGRFLAIRTPTHETLNALDWFKCFPSGLQIDLDRMMPREDLIEEIETSGLEFVHHEIIKQLTAENHEIYFDNLSLRAVSALKQIPDVEFEEGLRQFREYCGTAGWEKPFYESFDLFIYKKTEV